MSALPKIVDGKSNVFPAPRHGHRSSKALKTTKKALDKRTGKRSNAKPSSKEAGLTNGDKVPVNGYVGKKGKRVPAHDRTAPNGTKNDNWSTKGNINPETGQPGQKPPDGTNKH